MCNIDAGIKKLKEFLNIRQAINPSASGEYVSFFQMREILEAMRTKPEVPGGLEGHTCYLGAGNEKCPMCNPDRETIENTDKDAEIQLLNKELEITKKLLYIATGEVNNQADKNEKLKDRLAEADDLLNNPNTITIDRKVAQKFINAISQKQCSPLEIEVYKEFKRALGEKEVATADDNHTKRIRND